MGEELWLALSSSARDHSGPPQRSHAGLRALRRMCTRNGSQPDAEHLVVAQWVTNTRGQGSSSDSHPSRSAADPYAPREEPIPPRPKLTNVSLSAAMEICPVAAW